MAVSTLCARAERLLAAIVFTVLRHTPTNCAAFRRETPLANSRSISSIMH
jgi:hypothetical protein